ncbi:glycosyltransferase family 8 protein, partial [Sphaerobolus stellatus SS14]
VLNEWIGPNWERLSFTYNTTPTAFYTYAPAYKRFGSQINNVHFIGPSKPWAQIPFRSAGSTTGSTSAETSPAHDFPTLLDRWFNVYDKHYRPSMEPPLQGFPTAEEVPSVAPGELMVRRYQNVWDTGHQDVSVGTSGQPLGLDELKRLAIEGMNQPNVESMEPESGEGVYHTLPLEGRIDLMRPQKPAPPPELNLPEDPQTPTRSFPAMSTLPTPGPNELPPAPTFRGQNLPPETPTYSRAGRPSFETPTRNNLHVSHVSHSSSPLGSSPRPVSPPLLLWNPAVEEPPRVTPSASNFPEKTYFPNVWDAPARKKTEPDAEDLFSPPRPPPIPEMLLREGHYKNVIGERPESSTPQQEYHWTPPARQEPPQEHRSSPVQHYRSEEQHGQPQQAYQQEYQPPAQQHSAETRTSQSYERPHQRSFQPQPSSVVQSPSWQASPPPPQPSYHIPDRTKVSAVFPWEEKPRQAPERVYPRTDSPPPGQPFVKQRAPMKIEVKPRASRVFPDSISPSQGFPRTTTYANAWDTVPSIQRYAARLVRPPQPPQPMPSPSVGRRSRKGSSAASDEYKRWEEMVEVNSHDADDEDEDDEEDTSPRSAGAESDQSMKHPSRLPPKKYKVKGVQTMEREMKHESVQVQPARTRSRSTSVGSFEQSQSNKGKKGHEGEVPTHAKDPGASPRPQPHIITELPIKVVPQQVPELSPATAESRRLSTIEGKPSSSSYSPLGPTSPPESAPTPPVYPRHRPARRTFDPARGVDVFKKGSEEVLARFLRMDTWETETNSTPAPGSPHIV